MINIIGAIFCHVIKSAAVGQGSLFIIEGNQKWNGAAPNFTKSPTNVSIIIEGLIMPKRSILEPRA
jgi:hypothetical protein